MELLLILLAVTVIGVAGYFSARKWRRDASSDQGTGTPVVDHRTDPVFSGEADNSALAVDPHHFPEDAHNTMQRVSDAPRTGDVRGPEAFSEDFQPTQPSVHEHEASILSASGASARREPVFGPEERVEPEPAVALQHQPPMIFVVDDSVVVRTKLAKLLTSEGYRVESAGDGTQALKLMEECGIPDLVITDIEMPNMDGYKLIAILDIAPLTVDMPVVVISSSDGVRARLAHHGNVADIFRKPWDSSALLTRLQALVGPAVVTV